MVSILGFTKEVNAATAHFYEAEYISGIYIKKIPSHAQVTYYQEARFFRETGTNNFAYCAEPFSVFVGNPSYEPTLNPNNLSAAQKERISLLAHYGYGYKNHTEDKWYAITQFMIWQAADPSATFYFTDKVNGEKITIFTNEMNELNQMVTNYQKNPSMTNQTYSIVEEETLTIHDNNNVLNYYKSNNPNVKIENNNLIVNGLKEGEYTVTLSRKDTFHNKPVIFYHSNDYQDLVETGDLEAKNVQLKIKVKETSLTITKVDKDTKTIKPSGDATLEGATYELYDEKNQLITTLTIGEDSIATLHNLKYGKYYLKEIEAGEGYKIDDTIYPFEVTEETTHIDLILENEVIKKKIILHKQYGSKNDFHPEEKIQFNIYNKNNELVATITTNHLGIAEIELPYGKYTIKQVNSTPGYDKIFPIDLEIKDEVLVTYELKDYKIPVPNTSNQKKSILTLILELIQQILC